MQKYGTLFAAILVGGCAGNVPKVSLDKTSYPVDRVTEHQERVWVAPGFTNVFQVSALDGAYKSGGSNSGQVTYDFVRTEIGDTAVQEVWITPGRGKRASEQRLFREVDKRGKQACGKRYQVVASKYYFGEEATIRMLGFGSPALKVRYRCALSDRKNIDSIDRNLRRKAPKGLDLDYFDTVYKKLAIPYEEMVQKAINALDAKGVENISIRREGNVTYLYGAPVDKNNKNLFVGPSNTAAVAIKRDGGGSEIYLIYAKYFLGFHERGVLRGLPKQAIGMVPSDRKYSHQLSIRTVGQIVGS